MKKRKLHTRESLSRLKLKTCLALVLLVVLTGTMGYRFIEDWGWLECLYMTTITITTVGFNEVGELSRTGEIFTILLIFFGVGTVAFSASTLLEGIVQKQIHLFTGRFSMQKEINKLEHHIIICGHGRMGRLIVGHLATTNRDFVVLDTSPDIHEQLTAKGIPVLLGNATEDDVLEKAGIQRADALVAALSTDADNLLLTLTARGLNKDVKIIVRAENPGTEAKFTRAGANQVVSPYSTGASHIFQLLTHPSIVDFIDLMTREDDMQLEVRQFEVTADSPFANKTLGEAHVRQVTGCMVLAIKRPNARTLFDPHSTARVMPGDILIAEGSRSEGDPSLTQPG